MAGTFRRLAKYLLPSWLLDDEAGGALHWCLAAMLDIQSEKSRSGVEQRFPSRAGRTALGYIGADRLIRRGRDETDEHYAGRLRAWRYPRGHRVRGSVFALLEQISEYFGGGFALYGIDQSGNIRSRSALDVESYSYGNSWDWDSAAPGYSASDWARQWVVIDATEGAFREQLDWGDADLWGGSWGNNDGYCVGMQGASAADWQAIRDLFVGPHRWMPAGTQPEWLVVVLSGSTTISTTGQEYRWGEYSTSGGYTYWSRARDEDHRFIALRDELLDYAGETSATSWASRMVTSIGTITAPDSFETIIGDETSFPTTITMPDGTSYAGDGTDFPATIRLIDDGGSL